MRPVLGLSNTTAQLDIFNRCTRDTVTHLPTNEFFDILPQVTMCTMTMFLEASIGNDLEFKAKKRYLANFTELVSDHDYSVQVFQRLFSSSFQWNANYD